MWESLGLGTLASILNIIPIYICYRLDIALAKIDKCNIFTLTTSVSSNASENTYIELGAGQGESEGDESHIKKDRTLAHSSEAVWERLLAVYHGILLPKCVHEDLHYSFHPIYGERL